MKVLISGAGIAGPTLAYWLQKSGHEGDTRGSVADQRRAAFCPAIHANLANPVEIDVFGVLHLRKDPRALPADIGKDLCEHRLALLLARRIHGGQVLIAKDEEKKRLVVAQ